MTGWTECPKPTGGETFCVCLCVQCINSQRERMSARHWGCSGLPKCHLCLGGCWKSPQSSCWSIHPPSSRTGLGITEPRLPHTRAGGIPSCLKAPPALATINSLIFTIIIHSCTFLVKNSAVLVTKQTDPAHFPKGLPSISFVFTYCQFVPLGQILLRAILFKTQGQNENPGEELFTASCAQMCPSALSLPF